MLILNFLPFYFIIFAANLVEANRVWRVVTSGAIALVNGAMLLVGLALMLGGPLFVESFVSEGLLPAEALDLSVVPVGAVMALSALLGFLLLAARFRAAVISGLRLRLSVENMVHTTALVFALWLVGLTLAQVFVLSGLPITAITGDVALSLGGLWEQAVAFVLFALLGVGLGLRRGWRETMARLGIGGLTARQVGLVVVAILLLSLWDFLVTLAWQAVAPDSFERISEISRLLFGDVVGVLGALTIGLSAGIGEELLFRGAIQPRFGLVAATLLFTVGHTQYEFTPALFSVFVIGLVLGVLRQRENTTVAILIHAGYNALNVLLAPLWS